MSDMSLNKSGTSSDAPSFMNSQYSPQNNLNNVMLGSQAHAGYNDFVSQQWTNSARFPSSIASFQSGLSSEINDFSLNANSSFSDRSLTMNLQYSSQDSSSYEFITSKENILYKNLQKILNFVKEELKKKIQKT